MLSIQSMTGKRLSINVRDGFCFKVLLAMDSEKDSSKMQDPLANSTSGGAMTTEVDKTRKPQWAVIALAMVLPLIASLFYFVWFSEHLFARVIYAGTKVFTLVWPFIAIAFILKQPLKLRGPRKEDLPAIVPGLLSGLGVVGLMGLLMQTPFGDTVQASSGQIRGKAEELGFLKYYWPFAIFLSFAHSLLEEFYWRWFVFGRLRHLVKPIPAHLFAGVAFAAHHVVVTTQFFPLGVGFLIGSLVGVGGVIFSVLYERQGTLMGAWVSHLVIDLGIMFLGHQLIFGTWI